MLYELSSCEVIALQAACTVAKARMAENAKAFERCANDQRLSESLSASADQELAKWHQERAAAFEAVSKALDEGREITTLAQAKEALAR